jgi:putative phosphoesterase
MILGILSDSHGDAVATQAAIELLRARGATQFVHCGDVCGLAVLDLLAGLVADGLACRFVWGNCDHPDAALNRYVRDIGMTLPDGELVLELADHTIAAFHGHEDAFHAAAEAGRFDYILYGHTHRYGETRIGPTRLINPGALYRARPRTCATLDLTSGEVTFLRIDTGQPV